MSPKFSLQNVLDLRHGKVELLEIELGKLLSAHQETQSILYSMQEFQTYLLEQLGLTQSGEIDLVKMNLVRLNLSQVNKRIELILIQLNKQEKAIGEKRNEVIQAKQAEETLEILKRKRHEVYVAEQLQIETQLQDDIYIARAFRNQEQRA